MRNFILIFILALIHGCGCTGLAQTVGKQLEFNSCWGTDCTSNLVKNPSAAKNDLFKTTSNATATRDTSSGNKVDGIASWLVDTSANAGYTEFELIPTPDDLTSGNCMAKLIYKGDGTLYSLQILDGSNNVINATTLQNIGSTWSVPVTVNATCAASGARKVRVTQTTAGTSPAINVAKVYYGVATNIGAGVPNNVFSAKVSSTGVISNENEAGWLASCTSTSCTFKTAKFNNAPNCVATTSAGATTVQVTSTSTTTVTWLTYNSAWSTVAQPLTLVCTKAGTDFIQPAITPNQWNYGWTTYTPSNFQGFGTVVPSTNQCQHKRAGDSMFIRCSFTTGTVSSSIAQVGLPGGLLIGSLPSGATYFPAGMLSRNAPASNQNPIILQSSVGYLQFGSQGSSPSSALGLTPVAGNVIANNAEFIGFTSGPIPIAGWTENQNAPQLFGSVTSNAQSALRIESAKLNCSGSSSITSQYSSWLTSVGNVSSGACAVTIASGVFSSTPNCSLVRNGALGAFTLAPSIQITSSTAVSVGCTYVNNGSSTVVNCTNENFELMCIGPR